MNDPRSARDVPPADAITTVLCMAESSRDWDRDSEHDLCDDCGASAGVACEGDCGRSANEGAIYKVRSWVDHGARDKPSPREVLRAIVEELERQRGRARANRESAGKDFPAQCYHLGQMDSLDAADKIIRSMAGHLMENEHE